MSSQPVDQDLITFVRLFKKNINKNKKLEPKYFKKLSKIVRDGQLCSFLSLFKEYSNNEANVIGRAILKNKMSDVNDVLEYLLEKKDKYHIIILTYLLSKGTRLENTEKLTKYIKSYFEDDKNLNFFKLILVLSRKYRHAMDNEITVFCEQNEHPVLKEVLKEYKTGKQAVKIEIPQMTTFVNKELFESNKNKHG
ncbi:hypothetical protein M153_11157000607 [Pseudoloma neurophilia]|uniref:Uncharacterized protein n=1 Tax=Pseudoloma neurophilia TaxID=146866 RepID=A0A0R0LRL2_9MICR|nr:hypothetical protein M153_11157000607 [Pseudoloma neurophilia]